MFVFSLKGKSLRFAATAVFACVAVVVSLMVLPEHDNNGTAYVSAITSEKISFSGIKTPEDRMAFINSFGILVNPEPIEEVSGKIPKVFDAVYNEYNNIQKAQGLDLEKYKGKKISRYTYEVTNYPKDSNGAPTQVYLNLILYKNRVIGGDISSSESGGFVRTFCDFSVA